MEFTYAAYTKDKRLVRGKIAAATEKTASEMLNYSGYQVVTLKQVAPLFNLGKASAFLERFSQVKPKEVIMFSRQLALLLESGTDIINGLELLGKQVANRTLMKVIDRVVTDIRGGASLSTALSKHPRVFPAMYYHAIAASEQSGNLSVVLRQVSDYMERSMLTMKRVKSAMTYPIVLGVVALVVVGILVTFVLPSFVKMFSSFGAKLPATAKLMMGAADWGSHYGLYVILVIFAVGAVGFAYTRTAKGKYKWNEISLQLPILGKINLLNELSRCARTISLLFRVGLPLPEILTLAISGTTNQAFAKALTEVQQELIRGEGLSQPMSKRKYFLPLMVQMAAVGEETGNLDNALNTVAQSYETEADDRTSAAIGMIQPIMTIGIGIVIALVAVTLVSTMYGIYGQLDL